MRRCWSASEQTTSISADAHGFGHAVEPGLHLVTLLAEGPLTQLLRPGLSVTATVDTRADLAAGFAAQAAERGSTPSAAPAR